MHAIITHKKSIVQNFRLTYLIDLSYKNLSENPSQCLKNDYVEINKVSKIFNKF